MRPARVACLILALLLAGAGRAAETPEQLRARLASEADLIRKARLAIRLAEIELEAMRKAYAEGEVEKGSAGLKQMMDYIEQANKHLSDTGRDPRRKPQGFKDTEIKLRTFLRRLEDLRASLPVDERPDVEEVMERIREIQQSLLNGIMRVKERKKEPS